METKITNDCREDIPLEFSSENYDVNGVLVPDGDEHICARKIVSNKTGIAQFYVKSNGHDLLNIYRLTEFSYLKTSEWKLRKTSQRAYEAYVNFLKTRQERFLRAAERNGLI